MEFDFFDEIVLPDSFIDIQWFASADDEGRTHDPSEIKKRKAREEGNVAKSTDLVGSVVLLFGLLTITFLSKYIMNNFSDMMKYYCNNIFSFGMLTSYQAFSTMVVYFLKIMIPIFIVVVAAAILINVFQVGFMFVIKPIVPDFSKIAFKLGKFLERAFFSREAWFNLFKTLGKVVLIGGVAVLNIIFNIEDLLYLLVMPLESGLSFIVKLGFMITLECSILLLALSIPDYFFQKRRYEEKLKMSIQEVKEEFKETEGDPQVKSMIKEKQQELMNRNIPQIVKEADVVVTNPTHFAVVLKYDRFLNSAPVVSAKGADSSAQRIKRIARESGVPVIENKLLARGLYAATSIGDEIPEEFFQSVVEVFRAINYKFDKEAS